MGGGIIAGLIGPKFTAVIYKVSPSGLKMMLTHESRSSIIIQMIRLIALFIRWQEQLLPLSVFFVFVLFCFVVTHCRKLI